MEQHPSPASLPSIPPGILPENPIDVDVMEIGGRVEAGRWEWEAGGWMGGWGRSQLPLLGRKRKREKERNRDERNNRQLSPENSRSLRWGGGWRCGMALRWGRRRRRRRNKGGSWKRPFLTPSLQLHPHFIYSFFQWNELESVSRAGRRAAPAIYRPLFRYWIDCC